MNSDTFIEITMATARRRWRLLLILCLISVPFSVLSVRLIRFVYTAEMKLFALPQASQSVLDSQTTALMFGGGGDRSALLTGQDSLIHSIAVFNAVREVDPSLNKVAPPKDSKIALLGMYIGIIQEFCFGKEYVQIRQRWKGREFGVFKARMTAIIDIDAASISLKYKHEDPKVALAAIKAAADALQQINLEISKDQIYKKVEFLALKIAEARKENDRISSEITTFVRKNKISSDPRTIEPRYKGLSEASGMVTAAQLEISQREMGLAEAKLVSARLQREIKDGLLNDREGRLKSLTTDLRQYEKGMTKLPDSGQSKIRLAVKRQLTSVREKIDKEFGASGMRMDVGSLQSLLTSNEANILEQDLGLQSARKQLEFGGKLSKKYERQLSDLPELSESLAKLTMVQTQQRKLLEILTQRYLEAQIESDTKLPLFYVTEGAALTDGDRLGKLPMLLAAIIVTLVLILLAIVLLDIRRGVIIVKQQLSKFQNPHFIGTIAFTPELKKRKALAVVTEIGLGFRIAHTLKKYLSDPAGGDRCKVIAVTSKGAKVGKTVTSLGIATATQSSGMKTLVIDADYSASDRALRNQGTAALNVCRTRYEIFQDIPTVPKVIQKKQRLTLWSLVDEFPTEDSVNDYFLSEFSSTIEKLKGYYDCIVIDCAPCVVPAMLLVYEKADINILCFAEGVSTLADVAHVTEVVGPACKEQAKILSVLTLSRLKSNFVAANSSDGLYYRIGRAA